MQGGCCCWGIIDRFLALVRLYQPGGCSKTATKVFQVTTAARLSLYGLSCCCPASPQPTPAVTMTQNTFAMPTPPTCPPAMHPGQQLTCRCCCHGPVPPIAPSAAPSHHLMPTKVLLYPKSAHTCSPAMQLGQLSTCCCFCCPGQLPPAPAHHLTPTSNMPLSLTPLSHNCC